MNSIVEAQVKAYCRHGLGYNPYQCNTILECVRHLAQSAGYDLDERFARAGLGSGPEGRVASAIVDRAMGGSSPDTPEHTIRQHTYQWLGMNVLRVA